jgi:hypothetical protein
MTMTATSANEALEGRAMGAEMLKSYREPALTDLAREGWIDEMASAIVDAGEPTFEEAVQAGETLDVAREQALVSGRLALNTKLYLEAIENGASRELAFKALIALLRQNALRSGETGVFFPKPWVFAAAAAAAGAADLGATPEQQVQLGYRVFAAAAQSEVPDQQAG